MALRGIASTYAWRSGQMEKPDVDYIDKSPSISIDQKVAPTTRVHLGRLPRFMITCAAVARVDDPIP